MVTTKLESKHLSIGKSARSADAKEEGLHRKHASLGRHTRREAAKKLSQRVSRAGGKVNSLKDKEKQEYEAYA